jgi:hypothetical protein
VQQLYQFAVFDDQRLTEIGLNGAVLYRELRGQASPSASYSRKVSYVRNASSARPCDRALFAAAATHSTLAWNSLSCTKLALVVREPEDYGAVRMSDFYLFLC